MRRAELYTPNPPFPGIAEQEQAAWADAHARAFFVSACKDKEHSNSSHTRTVVQFDEIFGGQEGDAAVQQNFCAFLRHVDDFLQFLTLGISPTSRQNEK